jgi:hypothetical protein
MRQEMMLNELVRQTTTTSPCGGNGGGVTEGQMKCSAGVVSQQQQQQQQPEGALAMLHTMQSLYGAAMNPAVDSYGSSCGGSVMESHARQNSTDSGLGKTSRTIQFASFRFHVVYLTVRHMNSIQRTRLNSVGSKN